MHKRKFLLIILAFIITTATGGESAPGTQTERCLGLNNIKQMTILDDRHLVFEMSDGRLYLNRLPAACFSLRHSRAIMYRTSLHRLCDVDIITVLDDIGPGFRPLGSCGLGRFEPASEEQIRDLKQDIKARKEYK